MVKKRSILHVVNISFVLPYFIGEQFNYFSQAGYELHVACTPSLHLKNFAKEKNIQTLEIPITRQIRLFKDFYAIYKLIQYIKLNNIDIVIGHTPKGGLLAMISAFITRKRVRIYFRHGLMYENSKGLKKYFLILIEKLTGILANKVICVSQSVLNESNNKNLSRISKNILLANGTCNGVDTLNKFNINKIDTEQIIQLRKSLNIKSDDLVLGYVGRMVKDKGIIELLDSWEILKYKYPRLKLLLVGPFEERDSISDIYKNIIQSDSAILYLGQSEETNIYYAIIDVFLLLSHREGFPTVVLEASSMGIPIVTTKCTGCIDSIIPGNTGLFTDLNINSIVNNVSIYIDNSSLRKKHGENGRYFVINNFQQEIVWEALKNVIEKF